ncbi:SDR family oxidoreductase [Chitinophaga agrisoli]|uniref:SDR family oxidoreductase n=2 Tax=Chitinophaga agrisoli TaxID=2607653 RepID=A0A5B2VUR7_9BACT|nr:SDR family oxidoreductase [Chitinophaga agrisoli]
MGRILLAGATGYLGGHILTKLIEDNRQVTVIARQAGRIHPPPGSAPLVTVLPAELTQPQSIINCCEGIDTVISTVGITKPQKGLTYMDVDYQANLNLLQEARKSGVRKFIYISVYKGEQLQDIAICHAKEQFVNALKASGLEYCIIRPTGYFSDMAALFNLAKKGRVYLFAKGAAKINPISGEDLAAACVTAIDQDKREINIGGPQTMRFTQIAQTAFDVLHKKPAITYLPEWLRKTILRLARIFMPAPVFGPLEFFMTVMTTDMNAPEYGQDTLKAYFETSQ